MPPKKPAFDLKTSVKTPSGYAFQICLKIMDKLSTVGAMAGAFACGAVAGVGSVTFLILRYPDLVMAVLKAALEGEGVEVKSAKAESILVEVLCTSKESFLLFMDAFETKKIRQRLEEEFQNKLNFKGELEVKITNEQGVYEDLDQLRRLGKKHAVEEVEGHMSVKTEVDFSGIPITEMCEPIDPRSVSEGCAIDPPEASVTPPEKKDLPGPGDAKPLEDHHLPVDILLLTAKECEFLSCLAFLDDGFFNVHHNRLGYLFLGEMGKNEKLKIAVIQCSAGAGGPDSTIVTTTEALKILRPKAVFCVGFCGSLKREKVKLGDVVLSARLRTYALIKRMASGIQDRNVSVQLHTRLAKLIKSADYGWKAPLTEPGKLKVEVHKDGVFLSGPEVVDEKERREGLIDRFRDAIAIEMEGEGVYAAAHNLNVDWLVIKGVSDYADGKKSATDSWRPFASTMAASLTAHILSNPEAFKDWPHYGCAESTSTEMENKGLTVKLGCPSVDDLRLLAKELANYWKDLAHRLNFKPAEIDEFDSQNKTLARKATDMLLHWKNRDSTQATYKVLYDALCHDLVQNRSLAEKFCCP